MRSLAILCVITISCWLMAGHARADDSVSQDDYWRCLFLLNGIFTDDQEIKDLPSEGYDNAVLLMRHVDQPKIDNAFLVVGLEKIQGVVQRFEIQAYQFTPVGGISADIYNITANGDAEQNFQDDSFFAQIDVQSLKSDPSCRVRFVKVADGVYTACRPDCRTWVNGKHVCYTVTVNCNEFIITVPQASKETSTGIPYVLKLQKNSRYPTSGFPDGFKGPCDN